MGYTWKCVLCLLRYALTIIEEAAITTSFWFNATGLQDSSVIIDEPVVTLFFGKVLSIIVRCSGIGFCISGIHDINCDIF